MDIQQQARQVANGFHLWICREIHGMTQNKTALLADFSTKGEGREGGIEYVVFFGSMMPLFVRDL